MRIHLHAAILALVIAAAAVAAAPAGARSTFSVPVSNSDIETAFGWTDAQLRANESGLSFSVRGTVERLVDCLILLTPNGRILDHNNIFSKSFDSKVTDVAIGSDTISLSIPDPVSLLPDPGFACDALRGNGGPPVFVTPHVVDDLFGSIDVYATFEGDTELVLRIPL